MKSTNNVKFTQQKFSSLHRIALILATFYSATWVLTFTAIFWGLTAKFSERVLADSVSQNLPTLPLDKRQQQQQDIPTNTNPNIEINPEFRSRSYLLGPADQIAIQVQRFSELNFAGQISQEGLVVLPLIGTVNLRGITVEQAKQVIRDRLNKFIKNPDVTVSLIVQRPVTVTVTGQVARPGFYPLQIPQISAAIFAAGGTNSTADLRGVLIRRTLANGTFAEQKIDLLTPLQTGIAPPVLRLEDGDAIIVPYQQVTVDNKSDRDVAARYSLAAAQGLVQVTVTGEVAKPGFYNLPAGSGRISAALVAAGGATLKADLRDVRVRRILVDGSIVEEPIDLYTPLANATELFDFPLQNGDAIVVPQLEASKSQDYDFNLISRSTLIKPRIYVRVLSYASGGLSSFYIENGSRFLDALNGVAVNAADLRKIALFRFDREQGKAISQKLDAKAALQGDVSQNPLLEDNDVIVIGRNLVERVGYAINTVTQPFRDVLGFLLFFQQLRNGAQNLFAPNSRSNK
ncbi:polysaccharide export protein [Oscillatoriales cyanobacterium USR001]|nr:polysaccharide export protein [Oscillatoriales cyanobacterium USR001]